MGNVSRSWMIVFRELGLTCKVGFGKNVKFSQGLPGYVHLLGQLTLKKAIDERRFSINEDDLRI